MRPGRLALLVLLSMVLTASIGCEESAEDTAARAQDLLQEDRASEALALAARHLLEPDLPASSRWKLAKIRVEALARTGAPEAPTALERLAEEFGANVTVDTYRETANHLRKADHDAAVVVLDAGRARFPEATAHFDGVVSSWDDAGTISDGERARLCQIGYTSVCPDA